MNSTSTSSYVPIPGSPPVQPSEMASREDSQEASPREMEGLNLEARRFVLLGVAAMVFLVVEFDVNKTGGEAKPVVDGNGCCCGGCRWNGGQNVDVKDVGCFWDGHP